MPESHPDPESSPLAQSGANHPHPRDDPTEQWSSNTIESSVSNDGVTDYCR